MRNNDSDAGRTGDCFPTERDFELMHDIDSGPEMPTLAKPEDMQELVKEHSALLTGNGDSLTSYRDSQANNYVREMDRGSGQLAETDGDQDIDRYRTVGLSSKQEKKIEKTAEECGGATGNPGRSEAIQERPKPLSKKESEQGASDADGAQLEHEGATGEPSYHARGCNVATSEPNGKTTREVGVATEDDSPRSISLSASDVETAFFREMQMGT